jgi:hypothetical protein
MCLQGATDRGPKVSRWLQGTVALRSSDLWGEPVEENPSGRGDEVVVYTWLLAFYVNSEGAGCQCVLIH